MEILHLKRSYVSCSRLVPTYCCVIALLLPILAILLRHGSVGVVEDSAALRAEQHAHVGESEIIDVRDGDTVMPLIQQTTRPIPFERVHSTVERPVPFERAQRATAEHLACAQHL